MCFPHILFYNRVLDELSEFDSGRLPSSRPADPGNRYVQFLIAREVTLWHYQWLLVNEHLPQIAGQPTVNDVLENGNRFYRPPLFKLFGGGKLRQAIRDEIEGESVPFETEGVRVTVHRRGRVPGARDAAGVSASLGGFAVTDRRVIGASGRGKLVES